MATKKLPHNEVFEAKALLLKGAIKLPKNFIHKSSLVKAITDKYGLKR
ncbi:hypothetical protein [Aquirufa antheringensis]